MPTGGLGLNLKVARMRAGLEQTEVAERLGTHRVQVSKWERGVNRPGDETLDRLAELYHTTVAELLSEEVSHETSGNSVREQGSLYGPSAELLRRLELMALDFEKEMVETDVDSDFRRYARARLRDPELLEMYAGGHSRKRMSADEQLADYEDLIDELRGRLERRIALLKKRRGA